MRDWLLFLHIGAVLAFMLVHGVQVTVMWKLRWETDPHRSMALFDGLTDLLMLRLLGGAMFATGLLLTFSLSLWGRWWIWLSIVLLGVIWLAMRMYGSGYYELIDRTATQAIEAKGTPAEPDAMAAFEKVRTAWHPIGMTVIGLGGFAVILWLMIFKPV
jgi:hypothetical protein